MSIYQIDPTKDLRWGELVERHPRASVFHTVGWLQALRRTYGYEPVVFTTSPPTSELRDGLVFCRIKSWLTGRRLVSLPFADHCEPLFDSNEDLHFLIHYLQGALQHQNWRYLEVRPVNRDFEQANDKGHFSVSARYFLHTLSLLPQLDELFKGFDKDCVQRRLRRAERADLVEKCGSSEDLLRDFYTLFVKTRSRHHVPPTPFKWFRNLIHCLEKGLEIRVAYQQETPIAAILTLRFRDVVHFKYGCSDARFNRLGATPWLLWRAIAAARLAGATGFDFGRTDESNKGLLAFKNHWSPQPRRLIYWRFPDNPFLLSPAQSWNLKMAKRALSFMPNALLRLTGKLFYRHVG